jgi:glycosyltransferase involved in cell wall biosynthesis
MSLAENYILISAVRNEAKYIEGAIETVALQRLKPSKWIIVDDGSTDGTYTLAKSAAGHLPFVNVVKADESRKKDFASKVFALRMGFSLLSSEQFSFVGFLDADIRLGPEYYEKIFERFAADHRVGVAGGLVVEVGNANANSHRLRSVSHHVAGGVQVFRRECYESVGGYLPIASGGEDTVAEVTAEMKGWKVQTYRDISALHLRPDDSSGRASLLRSVRWGERFYTIGYHPLYFVAHTLARILEKPPVIGSFLQNVGFYKGFLLRRPVAVSKEFRTYLRKAQLARLRQNLKLAPIRVPQSDTVSVAKSPRVASKLATPGR